MTMRFRAEQVGSLLRPPELLAARDGLSQEELQAVEDQAILVALNKQRELGLDVCTDGEMRRGSWLTDMAEAVEGFVPARRTVEWKGPGGGKEGSTGQVVGAKLRKVRKLTGRELPFLKRAASLPFKITLPAPSNFILTGYRPGTTDQFYPHPEDLLEDLVEIVRDEVQWLMAEGVTYIQFDAPYYSYYLDPSMREEAQRASRDLDQELERGIAADNATLMGLPRDGVTVALHVCRGNSRSRWLMEGGYDVVAERLFGLLDVDTFLLEYDDQRAGGFEPLRLVPAGKGVVLGLVTSKDPRIESQDDLRRRIDEAARYVPLENLALSPQCGFASVAAGNQMSMDDQWRKLELVVETARKVWG
jgi:5-methyltetrahydropteroyltriglutamate--homocysteine methyltransferase